MIEIDNWRNCGAVISTATQSQSGGRKNMGSVIIIQKRMFHVHWKVFFA